MSRRADRHTSPRCYPSPSAGVCIQHHAPLISKNRCLEGWQILPLRSCLSLHHCEICNEDIVLGQAYYDGSYRHRAHVDCVDRAGL